MDNQNLLIKLDKHRIMSDTEVPPEEFLLRLFGKPCFPRRDLTGITGTEKCGKTFFTSMLMASAVAQDKVLELDRIPETPLKILWYDTEQSLASTKNIISDCIYKLAKGDPKNLDCQFFVFNVRSCSYEARMDYLVAAIEAYKPDMVIVDNVCDLIPNINEAEDCINLIFIHAVCRNFDCSSKFRMVVYYYIALMCTGIHLFLNVIHYNFTEHITFFFDCT